MLLWMRNGCFEEPSLLCLFGPARFIGFCQPEFEEEEEGGKIPEAFRGYCQSYLERAATLPSADSTPPVCPSLPTSTSSQSEIRTTLRSESSQRQAERSAKKKPAKMRNAIAEKVNEEREAEAAKDISRPGVDKGADQPWSLKEEARSLIPFLKEIDRSVLLQWTTGRPQEEQQSPPGPTGSSTT